MCWSGGVGVYWSVCGMFNVCEIWESWEYVSVCRSGIGCM